MARPEKPAESRRNRSTTRRDWTVLPYEGRQGPAPELPRWRDWNDATLNWWDALWLSPQATLWDQSGRTLHALAVLQDDLIATARKPAAVASSTLTNLVAQMRQIQARHGLDPRSMADMKWRVAEEGERTGAAVVSIVPDPRPAPDPERMPARRANKAAWVDWAVLCGLDRAAAARLTKPNLIEQFSSLPATGQSATPAPRPPSQAANRLRDMTATAKKNRKKR